MNKTVILERDQMCDPVAYDNERLETMQWLYEFNHESHGFEFEDGRVARMVEEV